MSRSKLTLFIVIFALLLGGCQSAPVVDQPAVEEVNSPAVEEVVEEPAAPTLPEPEPDRVVLEVYVDGQSLKEGGYSYADVKPALVDNEINDTTYYSGLLQNIVGMDLSSAKGAFLVAVDGFVSYVGKPADLYLAAYKVEDGQYKSIELDKQAVYAGVVAEGKENKGVNKVYLVTTPANFEVEIQKNGEKIGVLTIKDFMKKTDVGDQKVSTAMFDGSYLYNAGESTFKGQFLGINYETMLAKLEGMEMDLSGNIVDVEFYGTTALGKEGKNMEYSTDPENEKYFGLLEFYCMYDGKTFNNDTADLPVGLTAFINGTGGRWMTMNLSVINFIIE